MFSKRPTKNEDEDDLLRQQEEFLQQKKTNSTNKTTSTTLTNDQSKSNSTDKKESSAGPETATPTAVNFDFNLQIVERDLSINSEYSMLYVNRNVDVATKENGFPVAENLSLKRATTSTRGPSLYAQKHMKKSTPAAQIVTYEEDSGIVTGTGLGSESWKREIAEIKHENKRLIDTMNVEEIEDMRAELLKKLNPKTVAFLQSKQFKYRSEVIKEQEEMQTDKIAEKESVKLIKDDVNLKEKLAIPLEEVQTKKYANMSVIEKEKLSWLGDIPKNDGAKDSKDSVEFSARFNFEGDLINLDKAEEIDVHEGLHHHGDEADRPGYTVNELFMYLQSSFPSQKQIALKVFEKIISKAHLGLYDACFNANLTEYLLKDTPLVLVVRTCLDDTGESVWKTAISTLKALICNTIYDELFLDRGYLLFEDYLGYGYRIDLKLLPLLEHEVEIDEKVTDEQYAMYDLVGCLLTRTSLLQRFAYLINSFVQHSSSDSVFLEEILDILIRMGRHSKAAAEAILQSSLMDALCSQLIRRSVLTEQCRLMHCKAFKLLRVCISSIKSSGASETLPSSLIRLFDRFNDISFIDSLNLSLSLNPEDVSISSTSRALLQISIESLRTWLKLLSLVSPKYSHPFLDSLKNNFRQMFPSFVKMLAFCKSLKLTEGDSYRSTFDFQFASCIFTLVKMYHEILGQENELSAVYSFDLFDIAMRWLTALNTDSIVPDFDTCTCLLVLTEFILSHRKSKLDDAFLKLAFVNLFCENDKFSSRLFELCRGNSNTATLKQETPGTLRDSANHPSFGAIYFKGSRSVPLLNVQSPICLLNALLRIASSLPSNSTYTPSSKVISRLSEYISLVTANISRDFVSNIFDLIEINIVSQACLLIPKQQQLESLQPEACRAALRFALHLNILNTNAIKRQIIDHVLFNRQLFATLLPPSTTATYSEAQFTAIRNVYRGFSRFETHYWLFHPLLAKAATDAQVNIDLDELLSCLQYIHLVYSIFPEHLAQNGISNSSLFLFIGSVFLVDDGHFFNENIQRLLKEFLTRLLQSGEGIVCSNEDSIPGYGNVVDL